MEIHYGKNRITLFPEDIEEEIGFDRYESGQKICSTNEKDEPIEYFELIEKKVCLVVKRIKNPEKNTDTVQDVKPVKKRRFLWWKF